MAEKLVLELIDGGSKGGAGSPSPTPGAPPGVGAPVPPGSRGAVGIRGSFRRLRPPGLRRGTKVKTKSVPRSVRVARGVATGVGLASQGAVGVSRGDPSQGLFAAVNVASQGLATLGPKGQAAAVALGAVTTAVGAFRAVVDNFVTRGRELAGVSGVIGGAAARADVRRFQADIREADALGPQLAKLIENQQKAEEVTARILFPIKEWLLDKANRILEGLLEGSADAIDAINELIDFMNGPLFGRVAALEKMAKDIRDILRGAGGANPLDAWINALNNFAGPNPPPVPRDSVGRFRCAWDRREPSAHKVGK
jgi:hypothetical protein